VTTRVATVQQVGRVNYPPADHEEVVQVITDQTVAYERAFYLRVGQPEPPEGASVTYGDHRAWWMVDGWQVSARKRGYNFDPAAPMG